MFISFGVNLLQLTTLYNLISISHLHLSMMSEKLKPEAYVARVS